MSEADVVAAARVWLGTPYRHRASTLGAGCDCLGLLRGVWRDLHGPEPVPLPAYRAQWRHENDGALLGAAERFLLPVTDPAAAGQVVLFRLGGQRQPRHCGILVSSRRFIHAQEHLGVVEANLTPGWETRIAARYRFPDRTIAPT